jgi:hypothetical protein
MHILFSIIPDLSKILNVGKFLLFFAFINQLTFHSPFLCINILGGLKYCSCDLYNRFCLNAKIFSLQPIQIWSEYLQRKSYLNNFLLHRELFSNIRLWAVMNDLECHDQKFMNHFYMD